MDIPRPFFFMQFANSASFGWQGASFGRMPHGLQKMRGMGYQFLGCTWVASGKNNLHISSGSTTQRIMSTYSTASVLSVQCIIPKTARLFSVSKSTSKRAKTSQGKLEVGAFKSIPPVTTFAFDANIPIKQTRQRQ